jgi:hypothetical protein
MAEKKLRIREISPFDRRDDLKENAGRFPRFKKGSYTLKIRLSSRVAPQVGADTFRRGPGIPRINRCGIIFLNLFFSSCG